MRVAKERSKVRRLEVPMDSPFVAWERLAIVVALSDGSDMAMLTSLPKNASLPGFGFGESVRSSRALERMAGDFSICFLAFCQTMAGMSSSVPELARRVIQGARGLLIEIFGTAIAT